MIHFISQNWIFAIGFAAQGVFALRMAIQWLFSERRGKSESPVMFWQLSLLGSFMLLIYGGLRGDLVIIFGQALSYFIFIRNLILNKSWKSIAFLTRLVVVCLPIVLLGYLIFTKSTFFNLSNSVDTFTAISIVGATGQLLMSLRFVHQWYHAEKTKASNIPHSFWYFTLAGSVLIIVYAVERFDPVLIVAQSFSIVSSVRNIQLQTR
jgi:lipid-A-disaccharide synthase-like uncharacterized protein